MEPQVSQTSLGHWKLPKPRNSPKLWRASFRRRRLPTSKRKINLATTRISCWPPWPRTSFPKIFVHPEQHSTPARTFPDSSHCPRLRKHSSPSTSRTQRPSSPRCWRCLILVSPILRRCALLPALKNKFLPRRWPRKTWTCRSLNVFCGRRRKHVTFRKPNH